MSCNHKWFPRPRAHITILGELSIFLMCSKCDLEIMIEHHVSQAEIEDAINYASE